MWPARKPKPGAAVSGRINASAFARMIAGHAASDGTGSWPLLPRGENPYLGYNPHAFRHSAYQLARRAGAQAILENRLAYAHLAPDDFARAVVGHGLIRGTGDFYRDLNQQLLSRVAVEYAWRELRSLPRPHGLDTRRINGTSSRIDVLGEALAERSRELADLESAQRALESKRGTLSGDHLQASVLESNTHVFRLARLQSEIADLSERLEAARRDLDQALSTAVLLDEGDNRTYESELAAALARAASVRANTAASDLLVTVRQLAGVLEVSLKTVNSWIRNGFPTRSRRLWLDGAWGENDRGIRVLRLDALRDDLLSPIERERLHVLRLSTRTRQREETSAA
jgi:hypothetical protein